MRKQNLSHVRPVYVYARYEPRPVGQPSSPCATSVLPKKSRKYVSLSFASSPQEVNTARSLGHSSKQVSSVFVVAESVLLNVPEEYGKSSSHFVG